jgi:hypothetical protein
MRALVICGVLLFSGTATALDRASCFHDCLVIIFYGCRHQCPLDGPEATRCAQTCVAKISECKKECNRQYPDLTPPQGAVEIK